MKTRKLGWTDIELSTIGLGTWAIGGSGWQFSWGPQDDQESIKTIYRALDMGVNWIDTAAVYGLGHSERIVGQALKGLSQKPIIATKCTRVWDEKGNLGSNLKKENIKKECEDSLQRLQIDVIDLYQIHWPRPDEDVEEAWGAINELINEGKVLYGGVSNFTKDQLQRAQDISPVASLQPPYSMLVRGIEEEMLPFCAENKIGVIAYSPMYKGLLTGKYTKKLIAELPEDDHRRRDARFAEPEIDFNLQLIEELKKIALRNGKTVAQLAIAWVLRRSEMTAAIVGGRHPQQIEEIVKAGDWQLEKEDVDLIEELLVKRQQSLL